MSSKANRNNKKAIIITFCSIFCLCLIGMVVFSIVQSSRNNTFSQSDLEKSNAVMADASVVTKESTVTIGSAGDVLIHIPIFEAAYDSLSGKYNFAEDFSVVKSEIKNCDYFVANLETTLAGTENSRQYSGYPRFNSPDEIVSALKASGVDCLLTSNNHCYDTGKTGVTRTQQIVKQAGLDYIGTRLSEQGKKYMVKNIGSIKFGMTCYTYETEYSGGKALNGIPVESSCADLINSFDYTHLESFYSEIKKQISSMKKAGAEVIVVYLHWGNEYELSQNDYQKKIAQKLCDMGVDVIIGGHPHVVQPVDLLTSSNKKHKTVCVYSMGNFVSNQRRSYMGLKTGHTEDGIIFKMTFSKYSDGSVKFEKVKIVPTWVNLCKNTSGKTLYSITPLYSSLDSRAQRLGLLDSNSLSLAKSSYSRTTQLVSEGIKKCNKYLKTQPVISSAVRDEQSSAGNLDAAA